MPSPDPVLRHPESPRGPELREPAQFVAALMAALPPGHAPPGTALRLEFELDVDVDGTVTKVVADAVPDPMVRAALVGALQAAPFHPAWRNGAATAVSGLRVTMSLPVRGAHAPN